MPNLRKLKPWIDDSLARDRKNFREDMGWVGAHLREQQLRFQDRGPRYVGWIQQWLAGSPDQMEPTAIRMFY